MREITLTQNKTTTIDDQDYEHVSQFRWYAQLTPQGKYYAAADIEDDTGKVIRIYMQRLLANPPDGFIVFHKDGNGLNNQRANLEVRFRGQSDRNDKGRGTTGEEVYRGVHYVRKGKKKWRAVITIAGKTEHLGVFETPEEAARARDAAAFEQWGEHANLNFPEEYAAAKSVERSEGGESSEL